MSGNINFNGWINDDGSENYKCRAWVNFNGTGTVAIRASGNVSSITDNGAGDYSVNFTTSMPDANYCTQATASGNKGYNLDGMGAGAVVAMNFTTPYMSASYVRIGTSYGNVVGNDNPATVVNVAIFR